MRARGQNRSAHQRERSIVSGFAPVLPRLVSRPLTDAEDSLIPCAPDTSTHHGDGYNSCASDEGSPLHEAPPPTFALVDRCHYAFGTNVMFRSNRSTLQSLHPGVRMLVGHSDCDLKAVGMIV